MDTYFHFTGCDLPDINFADKNFVFVGTFLDDGRIPANHSITFECSDNRTLQSICTIDVRGDTDNGLWDPDPTVCPNITGELQSLK